MQVFLTQAPAEKNADKKDRRAEIVKRKDLAEPSRKGGGGADKLAGSEKDTTIKLPSMPEKKLVKG